VSALAGFFHRDGRPADAEPLAAMLAALVHRGDDARAISVAGPTALGWLGPSTAPEDLTPRDAPRAPDAPVRLTFDGRLDNREELSSAMGRPDVAAKAVSDAALVLASYERWGERAVEHLVGEFAFVLWDERRRTLVCARDALGVRPLFYRLDRRTVAWASEPSALLVSGARTPAANPGVIAEYLAASPASVSETLSRDVYRLPPAHALEVTSDAVRVWRYWDPDPPELRLADDEAYAAALREVIERAVASRLRARSPVAVFLSGGLDSSSVLATARQLGREARAPANDLTALSLEFPGEPFDERPYIDAVLDHCGVPGERRTPIWPDAAGYLAHVDRHGDVPDIPTGAVLFEPLFDAARSRGIRIALTGLGADEWLTGSPYYFADLIGRGRWLTAWREYRASVPESELEMSPRWLFAAGVRPLVPPRLRRAARTVLRRSLVPAWIDPAFARSVDLDARLREPPLGRGPGGFARADQRRFLQSASEEVVKEGLERAAAASGVELRHPFLDRRLVELALSLPERQRQRAGLTKVALRAAMRDRLPPTVHARLLKAELSECYGRALDAVGSVYPLTESPLVEHGWVVPERVRSMEQRFAASRARGDDGFSDVMLALWSMHAVAAWCRAIRPEPGQRPEPTVVRARRAPSAEEVEA